jgi:DNA polymerase-3 subunit gamma/tau
MRTYCGEIVEYVRNLLVAAVVPSAAEVKGLVEGSEEDIRQLKADATRMTPEQLQEVLRIFAQAEDALRASAHPRFVLEAAAVRATRLTGPKEPVLADTSSPKRRAEESGRTDANQEKQAKSGPGASTAGSTVPAGNHIPHIPHETRTGEVSPATDVLPGRTEGSSSERAAVEPRRPADSGLEPARGDRDQTKTGDVAEPSRPHVIPAATGSAMPAVLDWNIFQEAVSSEYQNIAPFLEMGRFLGLEGNQVLIGFAKQGTVGRAMLEKPDNIQALVCLAERLIGHPLRVRIVELTETDDPGPTMKELRAAKEAEEQMILFQRARAHPLIRQALELFGGELTEVCPRSLPQEVQE